MSEPAAADVDLADYAFELPRELVAQRPSDEREDARLLRVDRASGAIVEPQSPHRVRDLPGLLREGDLLVATATERTRYGRSGIYDVTVARDDGEVVAEFRGRSRTLNGA